MSDIAGLASAGPLPAAAVPGTSSAVFINEFHYDNAGTDEGEFVEIAGPAGTNLDGWSLVLYNGNGGAPYAVTSLGGVLTDTSDGYGFFAVETPGLQNGSPDGMALVDDTSTVVQFLSYEGSFTATDGPANGQTSTDVGVTEGSGTAIGSSLALTGTGIAAGDFTWTVDTDDTPRAVNNGQTFADVPQPARVFIHQVQGDGASSPLVGQEVTIEAVVVGDYEGPSPNLRGFYLQEEDEDVDDDPATSEGIFVFHGNEDEVNLGDQVRVTGTVGEFQGQTQLGFPSELVVLSEDNTVTAATISLPLDSADSLEPVEGMLVTAPQTLFVTEFFQLGRFGQIVVSSGDRLDQPTAMVEPGAEALAVQAANDLNRLIIDDDLNDQNPDPILLARGGTELTAENTLRGGATPSPTS